MQYEIKCIKLSPAAERELTMMVENDLRAARQISHLMAKSQPVIIQKEGQPEKERALKRWIDAKGGLAFIIDKPVCFAAPLQGRGGERG